MEEQSWEAHLEGMSVETVRPMRAGEPQDPQLRVRNALLTAGLVSLLEAAAERRRPVTVLLNDPDRFTDSRIVVDVLHDVVRHQRQSPRFRVLFATGSHSFTPEQRKRHEEAVLPRAVLESWERAWHDSRDPALVRPLAHAQLHHWVVDGEFLLAVGSMEPHYFAGVTGAHKTTTIGVMSHQSIRDNHYHGLSARAASFRLEGNPAYESIAGLIEKLLRERRILALNEVLVEKRLLDCTAGDPLEALRKGLPLVRAAFSHTLARPADLVVARVAPPLNKSLYQADKGIKNVETAVRDEGVILLEAECPEGVGIERFLKMMEGAPTYQAALDRIETDGYQLGDHKAVRLRALTDRRGVRVGILSRGVGEREARIAGLEPLSTRQEASRWVLKCLGERCRTGVVVEDAGNMTLLLASQGS